MSKIKLLFFLVLSVYATQWTPEEAAGEASDLSIQLGSEWREVAISGQKGYFTMQNAVFLSPRQYSQKTSIGEVYGYPFYQKFGMAAVSAKEKGENLFGIQYFYARKGWQTQDFFFLSEDGPYHSNRSAHMMGLFTSNYYPESWLLGAGYILNHNQRLPESWQEDKYHHEAYLLLRYAGLSAMGIGGKALTLLEIEWNMEQWIWGNQTYATGAIYFPRITYSWQYAAKKHVIKYEQNLWDQNLYQKTWVDAQTGKWQGSSLNFYYDQTRFFATGFSLTSQKEHLIWGWNVKLGLAEIGYSWLDDFVEGRDYRGSWHFGFHMNLGSMMNNSYRARGANFVAKQAEVKK